MSRMRGARSGLGRMAWVLGLAAVAMAAPGLALAGPSFGFDPTCSDRSIMDYLVPLFDSLFSQCGGTAGPFEKAIGVLNSGALAIGGILAAYTLVAGTMQTAHDGEMLGKKWSSMWLPIRTVLGVGLVVPISGGFCVAQLVMAFIITQGVGLADAVWSTYLTNFATPAGMAPKARMPNVADLARGMLTSEVCMEAYNLIRTSSAESSLIMPDAMAPASPSANIRNYGTPGSAQCGSVYYDQTPITPDNAANGFMGTSFDPTPLNAVQTAHMTAALAMETEIDVVAKNVAQGTYNGAAPVDVGAALNTAITHYQSSVSASATSVFGNSDAMTTFVTAAKTDGWYVAGAWFMKAVQMQDAVDQVIAHTPTSVKPDSAWLQGVSQDMGPFFIRLNGMLRDSTQNQTAQTSTVSAVDNMGNSANVFQKAVQGFMNTQFGGNWIASMAQRDPNRNALMSMKDFGDKLMVGSEAGIGFGVALIGGAEAIKAENSSVIGNVLGTFTGGISTAVGGASAGTMSAVGTILIFCASAMFAFAAAIAVYLPLAPFLIYFGAFVGWLILCAEAIIAAPLWAIMHLTPSGDDVMGGARSGYMLILGVLLRPALIVMGFVFALAAASVIVGGFNVLFFPAFKLAMSGSTIGLGTSMVMVVVYFTAMLSLFHTVFGLIHVIPDKLLRWIGGGHEQLGESSRSLSQAGERGASAAAGHAKGLQSAALSGLQTKSIVDSAEKNRRGDADRAAGRDANQMAEKSGKAAVANATADAPGAKNDRKLSAIASDLAAARQVDTAIGSQAKSDQLNQTSNAPALAAANTPKRDASVRNATERADRMEQSAVSAKAAIAEEKDPALAAKATDLARQEYTAAASAYEMLASYEEGQPASDPEVVATLRAKEQALTTEAKGL